MDDSLAQYGWADAAGRALAHAEYGRAKVAMGGMEGLYARLALGGVLALGAAGLVGATAEPIGKGRLENAVAQAKRGAAAGALAGAVSGLLHGRPVASSALHGGVLVGGLAGLGGAMRKPSHARGHR